MCCHHTIDPKTVSFSTQAALGGNYVPKPTESVGILVVQAGFAMPFNVLSLSYLATVCHVSAP